jgi:hypothetical protein
MDLVLLPQDETADPKAGGFKIKGRRMAFPPFRYPQRAVSGTRVSLFTGTPPLGVIPKHPHQGIGSPVSPTRGAVALTMRIKTTPGEEFPFEWSDCRTFTRRWGP